MESTRWNHLPDVMLLLGSLAAAVLAFQSWGIAASIAVAAVAGIVGARRALSLPLALAAASAAGAALVHFAVAPEHVAEWWGFGLFFVLCGEVQLGWALLLGRRRGKRMLALGIVGSLFLVLTWVISRTSGLPFGPEPGVPEAVGIPDVVSVALELVTVGACVWALLVAPRVRALAPAQVRIPFRVVALLGAVAVTAWALVAVGPA